MQTWRALKALAVQAVILYRLYMVRYRIRAIMRKVKKQQTCAHEWTREHGVVRRRCLKCGRYGD